MISTVPIVVMRGVLDVHVDGRVRARHGEGTRCGEDVPQDHSGVARVVAALTGASWIGADVAELRHLRRAGCISFTRAFSLFSRTEVTGNAAQVVVQQGRRRKVEQGLVRSEGQARDVRRKRTAAGGGCRRCQNVHRRRRRGGCADGGGRRAAVRRGDIAGGRPRQLVRVRERFAAVVRACTRLHGGEHPARVVIHVPADRASEWRLAHERVRRAQPAGGLCAAHLPWRLTLHAHARVARKLEPRGLTKFPWELGVRAVSLSARGHAHIAPVLVEDLAARLRALLRAGSVALRRGQQHSASSRLCRQCQRRRRWRRWRQDGGAGHSRIASELHAVPEQVAASAPTLPRGAVDQPLLAPGASHIVHPELAVVCGAAVLGLGRPKARGAAEEAKLAARHVTVRLTEAVVAHRAPPAAVVHLEPAMQGAPIFGAHQAQRPRRRYGWWQRRRGRRRVATWRRRRERGRRRFGGRALGQRWRFRSRWRCRWRRRR